MRNLLEPAAARQIISHAWPGLAAGDGGCRSTHSGAAESGHNALAVERGGRIELRAEREEALVIEVADSGPDAGKVNAIFEPYYTIQARAAASGCGCAANYLSTAAPFRRQRAVGGAVFMRLPFRRGRADGQIKINILVVDDERGLCRACRKPAVKATWTRPTTPHRPETQQQRLNLVITDMKMPGLDGMEFLRRAKPRADTRSF
jgi:CheY-like chemotaxis protein